MTVPAIILLAPHSNLGFPLYMAYNILSFVNWYFLLIGIYNHMQLIFMITYNEGEQLRWSVCRPSLDQITFLVL